MTDNELAQTIARLRNQQADDALCEAKECAHSLSKDIWESVSAFANTSGGIVILGLSESRGFTVLEDFEIDRVCSQFLTGMGDGGVPGRIANPPQYSIDRMVFEGHQLLVITISELPLSHKPCYIIDRGIQGGSYKRVDGADIPLSATEIFSLQTAEVLTDSDRQVVEGATLKDLDKDLTEQVLEAARKRTPRSLRGVSDYGDGLGRLNLTDNSGAITKAGLLVAGVYPQQYYPKLHVDVAVHPGNRKGGSSSRRFLDRTICEGTIGEMVESAVAATLKNLRYVSTVKGLGRIDEPEIPEEILREVIINALIHREYNCRFDGQAVSVDIFEDTIEVVNPGGLWGKTRDNLADGRSCCRNATLMRLMSLVPLSSGEGSPVEGNGTGIQFIITESLLRGLEPPSFFPAFDHFKVVLHRPKADGLTNSAPKGEAFIIALLEEYGEMSVRDLERRSGLSVNQVRNRLRKLVSTGLVEATAQSTSRNRTYRLRRTLGN